MYIKFDIIIFSYIIDMRSKNNKNSNIIRN